MCRDDPDRNVLHYNGFLDKGIDPSLPEYAILKKGMVVSGEVAGAVRRRIAILYEEHQARPWRATYSLLRLRTLRRRLSPRATH